MRKLFFFALLFFIVIVALFLFPPFINEPFPQKELVTLQVESNPSGAQVFLNEKEMGFTPWRSAELETGIYTVKLSFSGLNFGKTVSWVDKLRLEGGVATKISRTLSSTPYFSGGYTLSYQKIKGGGKASLAVSTEQTESDIILDGQKKGKAPLLMEDLAIAPHELKIEKEGFQSFEIDFEPQDDYLGDLDVSLLPEIRGKIERSTELKIERNGEEKIDEEFLTRRSEWRKSEPKLLPENIRLSPWTKLTVYSMRAEFLGEGEEKVDLLDWIEGFSFFLEEKWGFPEIPFCYFITEEGQVFEVLGVRDFDFSSFSEMLFEEALLPEEKSVFSSGVCPLLYFGIEERALTEAAKFALEKLRRYLSDKIPVSAKPITVLEKIAVPPGEKREITLEFQNTGEGLWRKESFPRIILVTEPWNRASDLYTRESWNAVDQITLPNEKMVLPGQIATFTFLITAPYYPGEVIEDLMLWDAQQEIVVAGSKQSLKFEVGMENAVAVEIKETPTGFLNIRQGPSTNAELVGSAYPGEKYLFLEEQNGWYRIRLRDGTEGWIFAKYAEKR